MGVIFKGRAALNRVHIGTTAPAIPLPRSVQGSVIVLDTRYIRANWVQPTDGSTVQGSISGGPWMDLNGTGSQEFFFATTGPQYFSFRAVNTQGVAGPVSTYPFNRTP